MTSSKEELNCLKKRHQGQNWTRDKRLENKDKGKKKSPDKTLKRKKVPMR